MTLLIRPLRVEDARSFLEVHHAAVHALAADYYPREVLDNWAPLPVTERAIKNFIDNPDQEIRLIAEISGETAGIGAFVPMSELRACYVSPKWVRRGVGSAVVREIERIARGFGATCLEFDASINAEAFYLSLGYSVRSRGEHTLRSGHRMVCVKMSKAFGLD